MSSQGIFPYTISESQLILGISPALQPRSFIEIYGTGLSSSCRTFVTSFVSSRSDVSEFEMLETQTTRRNQKLFLLPSEEGM